MKYARYVITNEIKIKYVKNKTLIFVLLWIAVFFVFCPIDVKAQSENSSWPMFHGSAQHGGQSPYNTSHIDGTIIWSFETGDGIEAGPVIVADGTIYVASHDGYLYAVNPDGSEKWRFSAGEPFWDSHYGGQYKSMMATPAIDDDGTVYVYSSDHHLIAVNSNGTEKWRYHIVWMPDFWSSPAVGDDGTIYIGSARDDETDFVAGLYAINPDGTLKWIHDEGTGVTTPPAIGSDGTIYIGAATPSEDKTQEDTGKILAISPDGEQEWRFDVELWVEGASTVGPDGIIYAPTKEGDIYAISPQGNEIWRFSTGDGVSASPAIGSDGTVYVGSWDCYFYALSPDGEQLWRYKTPDTFEGISSPAAIGSDGTIYVGSNSGMFYAFNPNGSLKWNLGPFGPVVAGPAIAEDGTVYFASWDKHLYAIGSSPEEPQNVTETVELPANEKSEQSPQHVVLIAVDCVNPTTLLQADTPNIDSLIASGSYTYDSCTVTPANTISAIPAIFTGAPQEVHRLYEWTGTMQAESIIEVFEESGYTCAIVGESENLGGYAASNCTGFEYRTDHDQYYFDIAVDWIVEYEPFFMFIYNPIPDRAGHQYGLGSEEYRIALETADYHIGRVIEALQNQGIYEETLIVVTTDHSLLGTSHSRGPTFSIWKGPGIKEAYEMDDSVEYVTGFGWVSHTLDDVAPTILDYLGLRPLSDATGEVISSIYQSVSEPEPPARASIVDLEAPSEVYSGETCTVNLTVSYGFTILTTMDTGITDAEIGSRIELEYEDLVGEGTKTYSFELTAPEEETEWILTASVRYNSDGEWMHDAVDWIEPFAIQVRARGIPGFPYEAIIIGLLIGFSLFSRRAFLQI